LDFPSGYKLGDQLGKYFFSRNEVNQEVFAISGVVGLISILLNVKGVSDIKNSTKLYNSGIRDRREGKIGFQSTENGMGLVFSFY